MKNGKLGYTVLGLGVGTAHVEAALNAEHAYLAAVCDLLPEKLKKVTDAHPEVRAYTDFEQLIRDDEVDIISVALPSAMHADFAVRAMEAGKHVLIEKPIDITPERAELIEEARLRTGMKAGVVHQNRNNVCMKPIKDAINSGKLGKLILGTFAVKWYRDQNYYDRGGWRGTWEMDGGGSLMNQAVHTVDLMQWLMGDVESVTSTMSINAHDIKTEDLTASLISFRSGATATFVSTTCAYPGICTDIQLYGSKGSVEADADCLKLWKIMGEDEADEEDMLDMYGRGNSAAASDPTHCTGHRSMVEDMIDAVYNDHDPQILPLEAIKAVRIVNAIYESAKTGKTVYLG